MIDALLGALSAANPGAPRAVANPAAVAKMNAASHQTQERSMFQQFLMVGIADPITPAGASQRLVDLYAEQYAAEKAAAIKAYQTTRNFKTPTNKLLMLWNTTPSKLYKV